MHDELGSLQIDLTGYLQDDEFETWVDFSDDLELGYDADENINFLPADRFPEVLG